MARIEVAGRAPLQALAALIGAAALAFLVGASLLDPRGFRIALAATLLALALAIGLRAPRHLLYGLVVWLAALGSVRRLVSDVSPPGPADALLLVGPGAIGVLLLVAMREERFRVRTSLSNAVLVLALLVVFGALNPLQGGLITGLAGLLFFLVPIVSFWVGRNLCDDATLRNVLKVIGLLAIAAALYGLGQTFLGFPRWDARWIDESGYESLNVFASQVEGGAYRPFSSFSAASEYVTFLGIGVVVWVAFGLMRRRFLASLAVFALLAAAIVYASTRGIVFGVALSLGLMAAARRGLSIRAAVLIAAAFILVVPFAARLLPTLSGGHPSAVLVAHQSQGLADPFDPESSTLPVHISIAVSGLKSALVEPLGIGIGGVTLAGLKFGGEMRGTETDLSNAAVALGIPGLIAYAVLFVIAFRRAYAVATSRRDSIALASLGILAVTLFQWLNGGHYAVAFLPWLILGWIERNAAARPDSRSGASPRSALVAPPNPNSAPDVRAATQSATDVRAAIPSAIARHAAARRQAPPKVAVCICTRNRPQELQRALASIAGSSVLPRQVLVSDDSDPEVAVETALVCRTFPDVTYISGPRRGLSANRNNCLSHLSDDVDAVVFIDDDVVLPSNFFRIASERIQRAQPNTIITGFEYRDGFEVTPHNCSFWGHQEKRPESSSDVHAICINATIFPRSLFESLSFDDRLRYGSEEVDICARAERAGFLVTFAPDLFAYHRRSPINREEYSEFQDASRLYATFKRYAWIERNSGKALTYSVLAPLHLLASVTAKRRSRREIRAALAAIGTAARYARSYRRSRLDGFRDDAEPSR